jgi:hypothetical protein
MECGGGDVQTEEDGVVPAGEEGDGGARWVDFGSLR